MKEGESEREREEGSVCHTLFHVHVCVCLSPLLHVCVCVCVCVFVAVVACVPTTLTTHGPSKLEQNPEKSRFRVICCFADFERSNKIKCNSKNYFKLNP